MLALQEQFIVDQKGNRTAVILPLVEYEQLLEDLHDLAVIAERRDEEPIGWAKLKIRLESSGVCDL